MTIDRMNEDRRTTVYLQYYSSIALQWFVIPRNEGSPTVSEIIFY